MLLGDFVKSVWGLFNFVVWRTAGIMTIAQRRMDKSSEEEVVKKLREVWRSSSLIVPCLCDGNSLVLDGKLRVLMERTVGGGRFALSCQLDHQGTG